MFVNVLAAFKLFIFFWNFVNHFTPRSPSFVLGTTPLAARILAASFLIKRLLIILLVPRSLDAKTHPDSCSSSSEVKYLPKLACLPLFLDLTKHYHYRNTYISTKRHQKRYLDFIHTVTSCTNRDEINEIEYS